MKLSEKIYSCRKKAGLSQEALAERLGVSRQAVSKWETGETEPEIGKLRTLAAVFSVSTDWLLSEEEEPPAPTSVPNWVDALPGTLRKLFRRYGWLGGVYLMLVGSGIFAFTFFPGLRQYRLLRDFGCPASELFRGPGTVFAVFSVIGLLVFITGLVFTVKLRKNREE